MTTSGPTPAEAWFQLAGLVVDARDDWRSEVATLMGMPFSRYRALRRCEDRPVTAVELAHRLGIDAPAASVVVTDLCEHGLLVRSPDPDDARRKIITITDEGRSVLRRVREETSAAHLLDVLTPDELATLVGLVAKLQDAARTAEARQ